MYLYLGTYLSSFVSYCVVVLWWYPSLHWDHISLSTCFDLCVIYIYIYIYINTSTIIALQRVLSEYFDLREFIEFCLSIYIYIVVQFCTY